MDTAEFYGFFDWMNKGAAAASFAFFGLVTPSGEVESSLRLFAIGLLILAMFMLTAAIITGKQVSERTSAHRKIPATVERIYIVMTGFGLAVFLSAIALLASILSPWLALPFLLGVSALLWSLKHVHNELLQ